MRSTRLFPLDYWNSRRISFKHSSICYSWNLKESLIKLADWVLDSDKVKWWYDGVLNSIVGE